MRCALTLALIFFGCGGHGSPGVGSLRPLDVTSSLNSLGVDTTKTPREDRDGNTYPDSFSPFGARVALTEIEDANGNIQIVFSSTCELLIAGLQLEGHTPYASAIDHLAAPQGTTLVDPILLYEAGSADAPWLREEANFSAALETTRRDATPADVDGDGLQEVVFLYLHPITLDVHLRIVSLIDGVVIEDDRLLLLPAAVFPVSDLRITAGDFDFDGGDELAVGVTRNGLGPAEGFVFLFEDKSGDYAQMGELSFRAAGSSSSMSLVLQTGNIDYDGSAELVVIVNELTPAASSYYVFDDADTSFAELDSGPVSVTLQTGETIVARVSNVAIGDLDQDRAGEIIFAGIDDVRATCGNESVTGGIPVHYLLTVLDDAIRGFEVRGSSVSDWTSADLPTPCAEHAPPEMRFVHVNVLDVDGDEDLEIQVDRRIFQKIPGETEKWREALGVLEMPFSVLFPGDAQDWFGRSNSAMEVADVNGDGRDDVISFKSGNPSIDAYGIDATGAFGLIAQVVVEEEIENAAISPILIPIDVDADGQILEYLGDHEHVFTEPLILAALAAPPCGHGIHQNEGACTTTWGEFRSTGAEGERELSVTAGLSFGQKVKGTFIDQSDIERKLTLSAGYSLVGSSSYELTKSVVFTTGPQEDSVVFESIPLDVYTYRVIVHPDPERVGTEIVIGLPRDPVVRIAELDYFNAHLPEGALQVGRNVFDHTPGILDSYPSRARKDQLLSQRRSQLDDIRLTTSPNVGGPGGTVLNLLERIPVFDPVPAVQGLETGLVGVGQGGGETEVALELTRQTGTGEALEIAAEFESMTTVATVSVGLTVSASFSWSTTMTTGVGTTFSGTVGSIGGSHFQQEQYRFGLFTYLQGDPMTHKEFQVLNYWVER